MDGSNLKIEWQFAEPYARVDFEELPKDNPVFIFAEYWHRHRGDYAVLQRRDFAPENLQTVIPWLMILEELSESVFRYRLCGTGCVRLFGIDYTDCELGDHLPSESADTRRKEFSEVWQIEQPVYSHTRVPIPGREFIRIYRGVFPIGTPDRQPNQIFVVIAAANDLV